MIILPKQAQKFKIPPCVIHSLYTNSEDCNSSTDSLNIYVPLYVQTNFDCSMSTMSNDDASSNLTGEIGGMINDVDSGLVLSSSTTCSDMMDFHSLLQPLPSSSTSQNVCYWQLVIKTVTKFHYETFWNKK